MKLTIAIPTHNSARSIKMVLDNLRMGGTNEFKVIIMDNGSKDGTKELLSVITKPDFYPYEIKYYENGFDGMQGRQQNIPKMRHDIAEKTDTEFIMYLDSDVMLPRFAIKILLEDFIESGMGMMGIRYEPYADHVQMGATIMRTKDAKEMEWRIGDGGCECRNCAASLIKKDLKTKWHDTLMGMHYK